MNNLKQAYIAIDLHCKNSMTGYTNKEGKLMNLQQVPTNVQNLSNQLAAIPAGRKYLTMEQTNMTFAMAEKLRPYVDKLIVCEPHHNKLISQNANKNDRLDTLTLCKLLCLDEFKAVWRPKKMGKPRLFFQQVKEYHRLNKELTRNKNQLQASLRHWGINRKLTGAGYWDPSALIDQIGARRWPTKWLLKCNISGFLPCIKRIN